MSRRHPWRPQAVQRKDRVRKHSQRVPTLACSRGAEGEIKNRVNADALRLSPPHDAATLPGLPAGLYGRLRHGCIVVSYEALSSTPGTRFQHRALRTILRREQLAQREYGDNLIVTIGDSRFAYLPRQADELTPQTGLVFRSACVPGTEVRSWYYMLRDLDPSAHRYRAIVFGVNDYYDEDGFADPADDIHTLRYVIGAAPE
jgi:hypothetical protein